MAYQEGSAPSPRQANVVDMLESRINTVTSRIHRCIETINATLDQVVGPRATPPIGGGASLGSRTASGARTSTLVDSLDYLETASSELEVSLNRLTP